jgi:hypothetical protein
LLAVAVEDADPLNVAGGDDRVELAAGAGVVVAQDAGSTRRPVRSWRFLALASAASVSVEM